MPVPNIKPEFTIIHILTAIFCSTCIHKNKLYTPESQSF